MATKKKVVDLKPAKITDEQLKSIQEASALEIAAISGGS